MGGGKTRRRGCWVDVNGKEVSGKDTREAEYKRAGMLG